MYSICENQYSIVGVVGVLRYNREQYCAVILYDLNKTEEIFRLFM